MTPLSSVKSTILNSSGINSLKKEHISSVEEFLCTDRGRLASITRLPLDKLDELFIELQIKYCPQPQTMYDLIMQDLKNGFILSTSCAELDGILHGGGIKSGEVVELMGPPSSGKTQMCHHIAYSTLKNTEYEIAWIDTSNSFSVERLEQIASNKDGNSELTKYLGRIKVFSIFDIHELMNAIDSLISQQRTPELVIIDNITTLLSSIIGSDQSLGQYMMEHTCYLVRKLAECNVSVLTVAHTVSSKGNMEWHEVKPALGESWTYLANTRLLFTASGGSGAIIRKVKSGHGPLELRGIEFSF